MLEERKSVSLESETGKRAWWSSDISRNFLCISYSIYSRFEGKDICFSALLENDHENKKVLHQSKATIHNEENEHDIQFWVVIN